MKTTDRKMMPVLGIVLSIGLVVGCAAEPDSESPGSCKLDCGKRYVAGAEYKVRILGSQNLNIQCIAADGKTAYPGPIRVDYQVYRLEDDLSLPGENEDGTVKQIEVPVGGVAFEPLVQGELADTKTNSEFRASDNTITPYHYRGVVTASEDFCSDTCGVMSYEVWPACVQDSSNTVTAGLKVGGVAVENFFSITITHGTASTSTTTTTLKMSDMKSL